MAGAAAGTFCSDQGSARRSVQKSEGGPKVCSARRKRETEEMRRIVQSAYDERCMDSNGFLGTDTIGYAE